MTTVGLSGLVKRYGDHVAVDGVTAEVPSGSVFFLLGPSGCGKTTLLRLVAGLERPDAGSVTFDGRDVSAVPTESRNVGIVFQNYALWPHMTVLRNVSFGPDVRRTPTREKRSRIERVIAVCRLDGLTGRYPHELSGGQQQRVALARALATEPSVLLLDEPFSNLDPTLRADLRRDVSRIHAETGVTMIFVTHDRDDVTAAAELVGVMHDGKLTQIGTPRDLYFRPADGRVARFFGPVNEFSGVVESASPPTARADDGTVWTLGTTEAPAVGSPVACFVRPEHLRLVGPGAGDEDVVVVSGRFSGAVTRAEVRTRAGTLLLVSSPSDARGDPSPGDVAGLVRPPAGVY